MYRIGIDVGATKINIGLFSTDGGGLISTSNLKTAELTDACKELSEAVNNMLSGSEVDPKTVLSVGVGVPGTVSADGKSIVKMPNLTGISEDIANSLEDCLGIPVTLFQDSRAAAYGEYYASKGAYRTLVCVTVGTGIGTGVVIDGKIYSGALGSAGELGHIPAVKNGRACGCGKRGCLEKYCAGGGLDITAGELLGAGHSAKDLFSAAKKGNTAAKEAIASAQEMLADGLVAIINLLSPEALLLSGGLSSNAEYIDLVMEMVRERCYSAGVIPKIERASLGELSPLYGAAFAPVNISRLTDKKCKALLSASLMCADVTELGRAVKEIEAAGIDYLHCDIMDNRFVPNLMLSPELINKLRKLTEMPFDYHIMCEDPERVVERLDLRPGDIVSVHYESTNHLDRVLNMIKEKGARAAVALNPATPVCMLDCVLPIIDMVLIMTVNPGFAGQKSVPYFLDKLRGTREYLSSRGYPDMLIQADGNCSLENAPRMYSAGADMLVLGTSSVFKQGLTVAEGTNTLIELINEAER